MNAIQFLRQSYPKLTPILCGRAGILPLKWSLLSSRLSLSMRKANDITITSTRHFLLNNSLLSKFIFLQARRRRTRLISSPLCCKCC
ncbi:WD-repeat protein mip1 [Histoplasma ohiense]|nr:WD-repeat protein mip1 [Histoplasma ohiense (nom. inval.)]